jgi:hypothetical protein
MVFILPYPPKILFNITSFIRDELSRLRVVGKLNNLRIPIKANIEFAAGFFKDVSGPKGNNVPGEFHDATMRLVNSGDVRVRASVPVTAGEAIRMAISVDTICIATPTDWTGLMPHEL